jgi:hypothetical protein
MGFRIVLIVVFISLFVNTSAQVTNEKVEGEVSYVTSKNIYVKFSNTETISVGDTLRLAQNNISCLVVSNKSSRSCVCTIVGDCEVSKGDRIVFNPTPIVILSLNNQPAVYQQKIENEYPKAVQDSIQNAQTNNKVRKESISGRISISSYSTLSSIRDDRNRLASRFSLYLKNIRDSKFSFSSYLVYRQNFSQTETSSTRKTLFFNVYDLALKFDVTPTLWLLIGRKINPRMSSVGAIDGFQGEILLDKNYIGAVIGSRPNVINYSIDPSLFQYGVNYGRITTQVNFKSQTTLGYMEQRNNSAIDRRYIYFQHSSTVIRKLNLFASFEIDLYKKVNDTATNEFNLTNLYVSARYRFSRKFDVMVSYDNRKRILYYESFQSEIERLLNDDIARQGVRVGIHYRPINFLNFGFNYSNRFQINGENKSDNYNGYVSYSKMPGISGRLTFSYNYNISNYLKSNAFSLYYTLMLIRNKLGADFYYRYLKYDYFKREPGLSNPTPVQNYFGTSLSVYFKYRITFSVSGEYSKINNEDNYRLYLKLAKRFRSKRK